MPDSGGDSAGTADPRAPPGGRGLAAAAVAGPAAGPGAAGAGAERRHSHQCPPTGPLRRRRGPLHFPPPLLFLLPLLPLLLFLLFPFCCRHCSPYPLDRTVDCRRRRRCYHC